MNLVVIPVFEKLRNTIHMRTFHLCICESSESVILEISKFYLPQIIQYVA